MNIVGLIPARSGSKGILNKNMTDCGGMPLIYHTIKAVRGSQKLSRTFLSTDDVAIAKYAEEFGIEVPYLRPKYLAGDLVPMIDVIAHFFTWLEVNIINIDAILLLQPTSPLRTSRHIDESITLFEKNRIKKPKSLVSVVQVPHNYSPGSLMSIESDQSLLPVECTQIFRRQDKPILYARNGPAILIVTKEAVKESNCYAKPCIGYLMDLISSIDVDDHETLKLASILISRHG